MSGLVSGFLMSESVVGSVAVIAVIAFAVHRELKRAGWADGERRKAVWAVAALLTAWFVVALVPSRAGFYHTGQLPTIQFGLLGPAAAVLVLFWSWPFLRRVVDAVSQQWIVGVQFYRVLGVIFLVLYAIGQLPGVFALPAGLGDMAVGLAAPAVGLAYMRSPREKAGRLRVWNLLGLLDLVVAVTTGFLTSPSRFQLLALDKPNELISAFPLVMIPVFLVPLSVLLHFASLWKLRRAAEVQRGAAAVTLPVG
ncbi:hypothetical protein GCM10011507_32410 [Edaphobacter acidisoli]|uniref:Uncharacterized protein n=1 Tax=Edaphobacter acidisoli TaxID=2040573 RepID=A0A916W8Y0_9BACT|nr:hypothetical protein [Edaphobacter acidisoli]GGA78698.1 hypothetical protein GCM10011507_32410 [Edaphobacter acidisoli]